MTSLDLANCSFSGTVDLTHLPSYLSWLQMHMNHFSGPIDLTQLPSSDDDSFSLQQPAVRRGQSHSSPNRFPAAEARKTIRSVGVSLVDLTQLPSTTLLVGLSNCTLSGAVNLTRLPASMLEVYLNDNQFNGSLDLTQLPPAIRLL